MIKKILGMSALTVMLGGCVVDAGPVYTTPAYVNAPVTYYVAPVYGRTYYTNPYYGYRRPYYYRYR